MTYTSPSHIEADNTCMYRIGSNSSLVIINDFSLQNYLQKATTVLLYGKITEYRVLGILAHNFLHDIEVIACKFCNMIFQNATLY